MYFYSKIYKVFILNNFLFFRTAKNWLLLAYLFINCLFILKYSDKVESIPNYTAVVTYALFFVGFLYTLHKVKNYINRLANFNLLFIFFCLLFFLFLLLVNIKIDGFSLNVDRWSALDILIKSILQGEYPYAALDHLGKTSSNLPALFYVGLPFYLLGDVGYLQPFVFLLIAIFLFFSKIKNNNKVFILALLLLAPSYYWEVAVKSDLMSNCFLVLLFIAFWQHRFKNGIFKKHILLAFIAVFFVLTRGIVVIPLTLFLFATFFKISIKKKIAFVVFGLLFVLLISLPVFINLPSLDFIKENNPFNHQTRYAPSFLIIISLLLPFFFSFKVKKNSDVFLFSFYILGGLLFLTFFLNVLEEGFYQNIYGNLFDLSYLSMLLPFIVFCFLEKSKTKVI